MPAHDPAADEVQAERPAPPPTDDRLQNPLIDRSDPLSISADNGEIELSVLDGGRVFKRRAIKGVGSASPREICWLVGEINGVRIYIDGSRLVLTTQDLYP